MITVCQSSVFLLNRVFLVCVDPVPVLINGNISASSDDPPYFEGDVISYECDLGFTLSANLPNRCVLLPGESSLLWELPQSMSLPDCRPGTYQFY